MIRVDDVSVQYGSFSAVSHVSLLIPDGEAFGIIGQNGAGKTTLIETMAGLRKKTAGTISINGLDPSEKRNRGELYRMISVQLQSTNYPDKARVGEICSLFASLCPDPLDIRELLAKFELSDKIRQPIGSLSGGQKQKLSVLLALISHPKIIFLDELTTGLDADARHELWRFLKELKRDGVTIILVSHFMDDIEMVCDRVGIMHEGRLVNVGKREELTRASGLSRRIVFSCDRDILPLLRSMEGAVRADCLGDQYTVVADREDFPEKCVELFNDKNIAYRDLIVDRPTLEDVFLQMVRKSKGGNGNA